MSQVSPILSFGFIALVAVLYSVVVIGVVYGRNRAGDDSQLPVYILRFCFGGFLLVTGLLALQGSFSSLNAFAPLLPIVSVVALIGVGIFATTSKVAEWLVFIPQSWLVALQVFRVFVEVILFGLAKTLLIPLAMTFGGRNYDILIGFSAPLLALYLHKNEGAPGKTRAPLLIWNFLGLASLTQALLTGLVMRPLALGIFPFVWIPSFIVPFGVLLHILSLRKLKANLPEAAPN